MAEMTVELVAVEQRLWSGSATLVSAQTTEGEIGIMPGHEPVLGQLIEGGTVSITSVDGERIVAAVHGGFLSVTATTVTILAESADVDQCLIAHRTPLVPDPVTGLVFRLQVVRMHFQTAWFIDVLYGGVLARPEMACRIVA